MLNLTCWHYFSSQESNNVSAIAAIVAEVKDVDDTQQLCIALRCTEIHIRGVFAVKIV